MCYQSDKVDGIESWFPLIDQCRTEIEYDNQITYI